MNHPRPQFPNALRRPLGRVALLAGGVAVAAAVTGVSVTLAGGAPNPPGSSTVAAAEIAAPTSAAAAPSASQPGAPASSAAPAPTTPASKPAPSTAAPKPKPKPKPPAARSLKYDYEAQITGWYCGPAATRIALTVAGLHPSQDAVAAALNTTENGTDSAEDTTRVLNRLIKTDFYSTREFAGTPTSAQVGRLRTDVVQAITSGHAVVANIVGSQVDTEGGWHYYDGGHYLTVVGYKDNGRTIKIADPAYVNGQSEYWMDTTDFANWMASRGYSA
ncbi:C39 family peptidase [Plantactinospora siamensis]|uniref:C39 family peptidase n=1 Tax=Plantactinospora siamensis TaxID=555372 RepID=A0ABV6P1J3_9ACTN